MTNRNLIKSVVLLLIIVIFFVAKNTILDKSLKTISIDSTESETYKSFFGVTRQVDTNIQKVLGSSNFKNTKNNFKTYFKSNPLINNAVVFKKDGAEVSFFTSQKQDFGELQANSPIVDKNNILYPQVYKDVDLKYTISSNRLLEEFIVKNIETAFLVKNISQEVTLKNIEKYEEFEDSIKFYSKSRLAFVLPKPILYELSNSHNTSYGIEYDIQKLDENKLVITKRITKDGLDWLSDNGRSYPIVIDLVVDNADTSSNWVSSNSTVLNVAQETTIKQEGTGSVKLSTPNWYNPSWSYRTKLTVEADYVDADLTDFPVYVNLNNLPSDFHTNVNQTDARDIRVTKSDGTTELPREVVFYTSASDNGELHFKYTGTLSGTTDTDVYIYYGNASASDYSASDTYGRNNVWTNSYEAVHHFQETSGSHVNSTGNTNYNSTAISVTSQGTATGKMGGADSFTIANSNYLTFGNAPSHPVNNFSAEAWANPTALSGHQAIVSDTNFGNNGYRLDFNGSTALYVDLGTGTSNRISKTVTLTTSYQHVLFTFNNPDVKLYRNGAQLGTTSSLASNITQSTDTLYIGKTTSTNYYFGGVIDEFRLSSTARAATWISTQYNNQNSPNTFFNSFGTQESITSQTATRTTTSTDLSSYSSITYWVRSNRTGSFIRFQFGESSSSEQTNTVTINSANTWEQKTWDISAIASTSRDAVTKYAFYVTDATASFDFYFDDIQASVSNNIPSTPTLDLPTNSAVNQILTAQLKSTSTDADSDYLRYKIELCENVGMTTNCQTFDQTSSQTGWSGQNTQTSTAYTSGTQATYTVQSALTDNFTYYWRSYAIDPGGSNTWSSTQGTPFSFTTTAAPSAPTTPYTEGSTNPTGIVDLTPEFSAIHSDSNSDPAVYYEIEVNTANDFTGTVMWDTGQTAMTSLPSGNRSTDVSYAGTSLSYNGTTYYWRIRFTDNIGAIGSWSATQSFSTNTTPSAPSLDSPADTTTNQNTSLSLSTTGSDADSDYLRYKIELCENVGMTTNCQTFDQTSSQTGWSGQNTQTSTAYTSGTQATYTTQAPLANNFTYYWRSYVVDPGGINAWSSTQGTPFSFTTQDTPKFDFKGLNISGITIE